MIFKHLFRSKHQSPNPQIRIQAIDNLNKQDPEQKSILHELAFNDADVNVSLAALQKLDSFVLWYKMSEISKNERVLKRAQRVVEETLLADQTELLSAGDKRKFVQECRDNRLLEKLLQQNWIQQDTDLTLELLQKLDKPQVQEKLLLESQNEPLQLRLLEQLRDGTQQRKLLNRLIKKSPVEAIKVQSKRILDDWLVAESLPLEIEQQVKMILSRLLALKDGNELPLIQQQQTDLVAQYQRLTSQFSCLTDVKRQELEQKYADISQKVTRTIDLLLPEWQAKLADKALRSSINSVSENVNQSLSHLSEQLATRISDITETEASTLARQLATHSQDLQSLIHQVDKHDQQLHKQLEQLQNKLMTGQNTLANLAEFQHSIHAAESILTKFTDLTLPTDQSQIEAAQDFAYETKKQWQQAIGNYQSQLPNTLIERWNSRNKEWQLALKQLKQAVNAEVSRCRNKIRAVDSLVRQGKFKAAMGLYQKVQVWFDALPEKQQQSLEKSFMSVKEQIENLQDWQEYIAAPRKPALLNEVERLITQPFAIDAQARAIKALRAQWNSLGKLDSESDQALNQAFDQAIEKAFEPCRQHYDKQQQERQQNLLAKQKIITDLQALADSTVATSELAKSLRTLQQKWKKIGEVDYKLRTTVFDQYQALYSPLREKVNQFYQANQEQKQKLLDKAQALVELESVSEAIEQVKVLQTQWKTIEHAGRKAEAVLWPAFRKANDDVFARRTAENQQHKQREQQQVELVKQQVTELEGRLFEAEDKADIQNALQNRSDILALAAALPIAQQKDIERRLQTAVERQRDKLAAIKSAEKRQHFRDIFAILKDWHGDPDITDRINVLPKSWQGSFVNLVDSVDRHTLVLQMEILAQIESPKEEAATRQHVQMQLMAQKLQTGEGVELSTLLKRWISGGVLDHDSIQLLPRLEKVYLV
ncbi:DUF349 domain-containing protein [Paraglaciecola aquimarina]|uniref:DUF349 domain-containing protein n=1 Tax=Paraglaciecola aquimarina TaxID=1235557 RepID=A0ABU3SZU3_9ALTE|nr:DUF349 domain-containing protein [Paraglaciecola aquimarina]MDU0355530.1 DUF349 domain-containing protein [Paraglaciecola aquimarina]